MSVYVFSRNKVLIQLWSPQERKQTWYPPQGPQEVHVPTPVPPGGSNSLRGTAGWEGAFPRVGAFFWKLEEPWSHRPTASKHSVPSPFQSACGWVISLLLLGDQFCPGGWIWSQRNQFCHWQAVWPWSSCLTSCFSLICVIRPASEGCHEDWMRQWHRLCHRAPSIPPGL